MFWRSRLTACCRNKADRWKLSFLERLVIGAHTLKFFPVGESYQLVQDFLQLLEAYVCDRLLLHAASCRRLCIGGSPR